MKKLFLLIAMCLMALTMQAQRCAVLEFKAGVGVSQANVDGISAIFTTYFRPAGYTMVERTRIDKVIEEQGFQRSRMTESQMVRIGQILNVSKIVVGDVNIVMKQYNVDVRVINVESGVISATEGATFAGASYRTHMQSIAQKLAAKIAIKSGPTVQAASKPSTTVTAKTRSSVENVLGYLKVFPNELGTFQSEPSTVISQINKQAKYGYNNWRIPTNEELSLLKANNYLGSGDYMTRESKSGKVLLVTDGKDYKTLQAEEQTRIKAEQEKKERRKLERRNQLIKEGYVDLGLPSGTFWNESGREYSPFDFNLGKNEDVFYKIPNRTQAEELIKECTWTWTGTGYNVTGPNGNSIFLKAGGYINSNGYRSGYDDGYYLLRGYSYGNEFCLHFTSNEIDFSSISSRSAYYWVRLVQKLDE